MSLTLRQLRYAVAAATHGNVTAAAQALRVAQPSISAAIQQLEAALGRDLFIRQRGQGVALTPFGRSVVAKARRVLAEASELLHLADEGGPIAGQVVVGCFEDLAPSCMPGILRRLAAQHPDVEVEVRESGFDQIARRVGEGAMDLAITYDLGLPVGISRQVLCELAPYALLPVGHRLAKRRGLSLAELAAEPLILTTQPQSWQHFLELFHLRGLTPQVARQVRSFELQRGLVAAGLGVALAYTRPRGDRSYDGTALVCRPLSDPLPRQRILLLSHGDLPPTRAAEALAEAAAAWFAERAEVSGISPARA